MYYRLFSDGLFKIWKHEGPGTLWNGLLVSVMLALSPAMNFMTYEALRRFFMAMFATKVTLLIMFS